MFNRKKKEIAHLKNLIAGGEDFRPGINQVDYMVREDYLHYLLKLEAVVGKITDKQFNRKRKDYLKKLTTKGGMIFDDYLKDGEDGVEYLIAKGSA